MLLNKWVSETRKEKVKFELLWKGSRDGFGASTFHTKCDKKGPTLTVVKSEHDKVFGGYTSLNWESRGDYANDPTAFIYSLTHKAKCGKQKDTDSIGDDSGCGPIFGGGGGDIASAIIAIRRIAVTPTAIRHISCHPVLMQKPTSLDQIISL